MSLKKQIFNARISGKPFEIKRNLFQTLAHEFKVVRTKFVNDLLRYKVIRLDISQPGDIGSSEAVFRLNDPIIISGFEYSVDQRVLFSRLNINGIVRVAED